MITSGSARVRINRKVIFGVGLVALALLSVGGWRLRARHPVGNPHVPEPAKAVDLKRYLGRWYEIARYDQRFERGCEGATADYIMRRDGKIEVLNRCLKRDGEIQEARGVAKIVDAETNAKLKVSFFRPFYGNYWVLDHADDYSWSIVGEASGRYLWILSRAPKPSDQVVGGLIKTASAMGYDTSMLIFDRHRRY